MNLFKSLLSDSDAPISNDDPTTTTTTTTSSWSFTDLIKTVTTKSESVIGSYRRDFQEFGTELKKETCVIRQVASRAVKDLPDSLEIAQESLESVGQVIDDIGATVWKSTAKIISHGKQSLLSDQSSSGRRHHEGLVVKPYNRFEKQLLALQGDRGTYVREPDYFKDFENWVLGFRVEEKGSEIVELLNENRGVKEIYDAVVDKEVDEESFWRRYFYRVYKLEQLEEARVKLVKRAISGEEDEEELSWDLDDEGDETNGVASSSVIEEEKENVVYEEEKVESSKDSDISVISDMSVISTQPSLPEVEDLGWDQMEEDIRSNEGRSLEAGQGSGEKSDWRRRVSVGDEEDDLS